MTPQQEAFGRVHSAWDHYNLERRRQGLPESPPPERGKLAGMIRNAGGFERMEDLMRLIRQLAHRGELTQAKVFAKIRTLHGPLSGNGQAKAHPSRAGHAPAEWDETRRRRLEEIERQSRETRA